MGPLLTKVNNCNNMYYSYTTSKERNYEVSTKCWNDIAKGQLQGSLAYNYSQTLSSIAQHRRGKVGELCYNIMLYWFLPRSLQGVNVIISHPQVDSEV